MFTIFTIVTLHILLNAQRVRRQYNGFRNDLVWRIRNYYFEYKLAEQNPFARPFIYVNSLLAYIDLKNATILLPNMQDMISQRFERYITRDEPFNLYEPIEIEDIPDLRYPKDGIRILPYRYHSKGAGIGYVEQKEVLVTNDPLSAEEPLDRKPETYIVDADLSGNPPHPVIANIIFNWFPNMASYLKTFCRPPAFGPQAFYDFNRSTASHPAPEPAREKEILEIIDETFNVDPYQPLHFADTLASGIPLATSAPYNAKHSVETQILSRWSSPAQYADKPSSKGHHINSILGPGRLAVHNIKHYGSPTGDTLEDCLQEDSTEQARLRTFFLSEPTELFIRTQISKRDPKESKKIRPVYAVCLLFILIEIMLTFGFIVQLRKPECCVMHGMETFRGAMSLIDQIAHYFSWYVSLDWSQFDQRLPLYVIIAYYAKWLPTKIVVNKGYAGTLRYPVSANRLSTDAFALRIFNLLRFLLLWYINLVFISYDGFAYVRLNGGVPSGLFNTQSLDSFGNMYILADCLLEFGFSRTEIREMIFFILGDDNVFFGRTEFKRVIDFMQFLEEYAKTRHGMVLSVLKSTFTTLRNKIEVLGYTNELGMPVRPIGKLVAQLAFPERPVPSDKEWMHAARALGLAYAACGSNAEFHALCYMVYKEFKPDRPVHAGQFYRVMKREVLEMLNYQFDLDVIDFPDFPSLLEVRKLVSSYHGYSSPEDKWKRTYFTSSPMVKDPDVITLADWLREHPEHVFYTDNIMPSAMI